MSLDRFRRFVFGFAIYSLVVGAASDGPLWYRLIRGVGGLALLWIGAGGWRETDE